MLTAAGCKQSEISPDEQPNIILILTDDHRYDALGFLGHPFLETPNLDRMAHQGVFFENAFVTTSLCSPSRASILTGLYAHNHGVIDNYNPVSESLKFFPQYLQDAGYETAFIGKWHMGNIDTPQRGFDYWLSFKGQGVYWPDGHGTTRVVPQASNEGFNINGKRVPQKAYITDELTDYAIDWLENRTSPKPYMLYLSHKAVHSDFVAHDRHRGRYAAEKMPEPPTLANSSDVYSGKPMWLKNQRNSRHGVDYAYNLDDFDLNRYYQRYCESLLAVDENLGRIFEFLENRNELNSTLILYMGDNGFQFGEHGLIDKRTAYEASIRIPLLMMYPEILEPGTRVEDMVANIDLAPTLLQAAGVRVPDHMDGISFYDAARGMFAESREALLYEYFWERNYPYTPTIHAIRTKQHKYIRYHGIWDIDELYDITADPHEADNLVFSDEYNSLLVDLRTQLFQILSETDGLNMPLLPDRGAAFPWRHRNRTGQAVFPEEFLDIPPEQSFLKETNRK
jgi:N-acetylglucosamine-6-sulfatase